MPMKQIDQDPGDYRVQAADGGWQQRVNRPLCRWLGIAVLAFLAYSAWSFGTEGGNPILIIFAGVMGFCAGGLITLSLKPIS